MATSSTAQHHGQHSGERRKERDRERVSEGRGTEGRDGARQSAARDLCSLRRFPRMHERGGCAAHSNLIELRSQTHRRTHTQAHLRGLSRAPVIRKTRAAFCPPCSTVCHRPSDAGSHSCITVVTSVSALQNTSVIMGSAAMERSGRGRRRPAATSGQHRTGVSVDSVRELRHGGRNPHAGVRR